MNVQYHNIKSQKYQNVWDFQTLMHNDIKAQKRIFLKNSDYNKTKPNFLNHLVFCEHNHVLTLGKSASFDNLLTPKTKLVTDNVELFDINRGGDITYHGPGQITGYLIFDLEMLYRDVHKFVRNIEECIIQFLRIYKVTAFRLDTFTGVWVGSEDNLRKICAIGVHLSRWVSMHGFGLNINTDLSYFKNIIPCGIQESNKSVTSLAQEIGQPIDMNVASKQLKDVVLDVFNLNEVIF